MRRYEPYEERKLRQSIAQGDPHAFSELVNRYWNNIYSQALVYVKSTHVAKDIVQDIFLKVWEKRNTLPDIERIDAFLFIMARNQIISSFRKKIALPTQQKTAFLLSREEGLTYEAVAVQMGLSRETVKNISARH